MCHISSSFASSIITEHDNPPSATAPNSLEMLQKRAQEVLDSASQGLLSGNLVDELAFRKEKQAGVDGLRGDNLFKHRCRYCGKVFGSDSALQIHIRSHTGERPFHCHVCGSRFTTKGNLKVHFQRHTQTFSYLQMGNGMMPEHHPEQFHPGMRYPAPIPPPADTAKYQQSIDQMKLLAADKKTFAEAQDEPANLSKTVNEQEQFCSKPLSIRENERPSISQMVSSDEDDEPENLSKKSRRSSCSERVISPPPPLRRSETSKLQSLVDNIDHNDTSDLNQCPVCFKILPCRQSIQVHLQTHCDEGPFKCNICGRSFDTIEHLKLHLSAHKLQNEQRSLYQCPICNKHFTNESYLVEHIKIHEPKPVQSIKSDSEDEEDLESQNPEPLSLVNAIMKRTTTPKSIDSSSPDLHAAESTALDLTPKSHPSSKVSAIMPPQLSHMQQSAAIGMFPNFPFLPGTQSTMQPVNPLSSLAQSVMPTGPFNPLGLSGMSAAGSCHNLIMNVDQGYHFLNDLVPGIRGNTTCNICFKTFACHSALEIHYRSHTKERPFKCSVCERGFSTKVSGRCCVNK